MYSDRLAASRKLHSRRGIKGARTRAEGNLQETDGGIAREHFAARTEFLRGPANSDKQFTIDPCSSSGRVISLSGGDHLPSAELRGEGEYYAESSLKLYHSTVNNLKGSRGWALHLLSRSDRSHFLSISRRLVMHSRTYVHARAARCSFNEITM